MKKLIFGIAVVALGVGLFGTPASGQLWWENPAIKSKTSIEQFPAFQYSNMDETFNYLWVAGSYGPGANHMLYDVDTLIAATTATNTPSVAKVNSAVNGYTAFKTAALSAELGRVIVFNGGATPNRQYTSGPLSSTWIRSNTVFVVTNNANIYADAGDFDNLGEYLYANISSPSTGRTNVWRLTVGNLETHGSDTTPNLTSNKIIPTSNNRVRNLSMYNIDGKDLLYYGSGTGDAAGGGKVWVYDTSTDTETQIIQQGDGVPYGEAYTHDIMNVKVSGIGTSQMYLYVTEQTGATNTTGKGGIQIFPLNADGKSVGAMVKNIPYAEFTPQLGIPINTGGEIRGFEVSADGKYLFFCGNIGHTGFPAYGMLYVIHTPPPMGTTFLVR